MAQSATVPSGLPGSFSTAERIDSWSIAGFGWQGAGEPQLDNRNPLPWLGFYRAMARPGRFRRVAACLGLAGLLAVCAVAPAADAALYKADRPGLHISIHTRGDHVQSANVRFRMRCRTWQGRFQNAVVGFPKAFYPIDPKSGHFSGQRGTTSSSPVVKTQRLAGTVGREGIGGRFSFRRLSDSGEAIGCWSGAGPDDPAVNFFAHRVRPALNAPYFRTEKPPVSLGLVSLGFLLQGKRLTIAIAIRTRCPGHRPGGLWTGGYAEVNPRTGKFLWIESNDPTSELLFDVRVKGTVRNDRITGHAFGATYHYGRCLSGSPGDPWVPFVARRQPQHGKDLL